MRDYHDKIITIKRKYNMNQPLLLCPSTMCIDCDFLKDEIIQLDQAGIDIFHCDIMDGNYVKNMALSPNDVRSICKNTKKPVDVHLMVSNPEVVSELYLKTDVSIIYIHPDTAEFPDKLLLKIKTAGKKVGIAINPQDSILKFAKLIPLCDYILVMTVNPGFAGQKYLEWVEPKIMELILLKNENNFKLIVDGACSPSIIKKLYHLGVDGFVVGTSALFNKNESYDTIIKQIRDENK